MNSLPATLELRCTQTEKVLRALESFPVARAGTGIVFLSGSIALEAGQLADELSEMHPQTRWVIASGPGVLTDRGELSGDSSAVVLLLSKKVELVTASHPHEGFAGSINSAMQSAPGASGLLLIRGDLHDHSWVNGLDGGSENISRLFGGGTLPDRAIHVCTEDGHIECACLALLLPRSHWGRVRSSSAARLISPLGEISRARDRRIEKIDGQPALELLSDYSSELDERSLILVAEGHGEKPLSSAGRSLALHPIHGVDPERGSLYMGSEFEVGARIAFAVRDKHQARKDLAAQLTDLARDCRGACTAFGIYVNCAGRGEGLYEAPNVDSKLIKKQFPKMPLIGLESTFELAPQNGKLVPQIYAGVLGVFCQPS